MLGLRVLVYSGCMLLGVIFLGGMFGIPASAASVAPKEQVKSFTCDDKSIKECAVSVDKAVNEWLADNPSVVIVDRKVSIAVGPSVVPQISSQAYAITLFYSTGLPRPPSGH